MGSNPTGVTETATYILVKFRGRLFVNLSCENDNIGLVSGPQISLATSIKQLKTVATLSGGDLQSLTENQQTYSVPKIRERLRRIMVPEGVLMMKVALY